MALEFNANTERVTVSASASINTLDTQTWIFWQYYGAAGSPSASARLFYKTEVQIWVDNSGSVADGFRYFRNRVTTGTDLIPSTTYALNAWNFMAMTDGDGVAPRAWMGTLTGAATEVAYNTQTTGVDAPIDDSGTDLLIGGRPANNTYINGSIAYMWVYNRILTIAEILMHQFRPATILSGCVMKYAFGFNGTGTQPDLSGNGNAGTVTGATVATHVPLGPAFGWDVFVLPTTAVAQSRIPRYGFTNFQIPAIV